MRNTLRVLRAGHGEHGVSQHTVAQALGIHRDRLHRIERGYTEPTPDERKALAAYFGVRESVVFPRSVKGKASGASV